MSRKIEIPLAEVRLVVKISLFTELPHLCSCWVVSQLERAATDEPIDSGF